MGPSGVPRGMGGYLRQGRIIVPGLVLVHTTQAIRLRRIMPQVLARFQAGIFLWNPAGRFTAEDAEVRRGRNQVKIHSLHISSVNLRVLRGSIELAREGRSADFRR